MMTSAHNIAEKQALELGSQALWYAWGAIDFRFNVDGFGTDHGIQFSMLYGEAAHLYATEKRTHRPSIINAWQRFVAYKLERGLDAALTVDDIYDF
jgi:hypothetical protein